MVLPDKRTRSPSLCEFITLITYQFSLLPFACLACLCAGLRSRTLVYTPYPTRCVDLSFNIRDSVFLRFHSCLLSSRTNHFLSFLFFTKVFFNLPPTPCLVSHFSLFTLLFTLPDFLQQLASPACLHFSLLCQNLSLCGRTGELD